MGAETTQVDEGGETTQVDEGGETTRLGGETRMMWEAQLGQ